MEVPARKGRGVLVRRGETLAVRDVHGAQVGDLFAFVAEDPTEHLSASHTRSALRRLFPAIGEAFFTNRRRPILTLVSDTSPGIHDLLIAACDPERYRQLGVEGHHDSCEENLRECAVALGFTPDVSPSTRSTSS
ncbi:MAG: urea carboxylase-associated family protein [Acidimicrobiales bacterium]|nr:urea carboxylase-associated family protein [Acidimicrobiales bacterium]